MFFERTIELVAVDRRARKIKSRRNREEPDISTDVEDLADRLFNFA